MKEYTHTNDFNGLRCLIKIQDILRQGLIGAGVKPTSALIEVENEDGTTSLVFPWEVSTIIT